jgi:hypothetical protein
MHAQFSNAGSQAWFGGSDSTGTIHVDSDGVLGLTSVAFTKSDGYAVVVRGRLSCSETNLGGFGAYYTSTRSAAQTCP